MSLRRCPVLLLTAIILIAAFSPWVGGAQQRGGNPTTTTPQRGGTTQTQPGAPQSGVPNTQTTQQSGSVSGTVGQVGLGIPIKRATVTFNRLPTPAAGGTNVVAADNFGTNSPNTGGGRGGGGGGGGNRSVQADNNGMYTITGLAEGQYRVIASAAGFVTQEYGQPSFDAPGTPVNVTAGSPQTIDFQLIAGGLIEGTVLDDDGFPIVAGQVQLYVADYSSGQRMLVPSKNAQTDDIGVFRLPALDPGDYYLAASPSSAQAILPPDTAVPQTTAIPGRGGPPQGGRGGRGGRGGQQTAANGQPAADQPVAPPTRAYAPTFFPGTTDTAQATPVHIAPGFQAHGININLKAVTLITIKGSVIIPTGFAPAATPQPQQPTSQQQNGNGGAGRGAGNQTGGGNRGTGGTTGGGGGGGARGGNNLAAQGRGGRGGGTQTAPGNATPGNGAPAGTDSNAAGGRGGRGGPGGDFGGGRGFQGGFEGGGGGATVVLMPVGIRAGSGGRGGGGGGGGGRGGPGGGPGGDTGGGGGRGGGGGGGGRGNNFAAQGPGGRGGRGGPGGDFGGFGQDFPGGGRGGSETAVGGTQAARVSTNEDGTFQIDNVLPGSYVVFAEARSNNVQMTAYNRLDVAYGNIDNYTLALRPGMAVPGQIYYDGQLPQNFQPRSIQISLAPMDNLPIGSVRATVSDDNKFTFANVAPGRYRMTVSVSQASGGYAMRALFGGTDALTDVFPLDSESTPLQILVGFTQGRIEAIAEQTGRPFPGARVLLAPATRSRLDLFRVASADKDGKATFANVAPGNYKLFAWESLAKSNAYQDPKFLEEYEDHGRPVSIDKSGAVTENHLQVMPATH